MSDQAWMIVTIITAMAIAMELLWRRLDKKRERRMRRHLISQLFDIKLVRGEQ